MKIYRMIVITLILEILFSFFTFREGKTIRYAYKENNEVNYKVFLKENKYFDSPYLEKGKTYITSLIDYINAEFTYNVDFTSKVTGDLNYQLVAEINADKEKSEVGTYWTKQYELTESKSSSITNEKSHSIKVSEKIDYNKYNDLMTEFIEDFKVQTESTLKISLLVKGNVKVDGSKENMEVDSEISLTVPLSKLAIEGKIDVLNNNAEKEIVKKVTHSEQAKKVFKTLLGVNTLILLYYIYKAIKRERIINNSLDYRKG